MSRWIIGLLVLGLVFTLAQLENRVAAADPEQVKDVTSKVICPCGCGMTVAACRESMECSLAPKMATLADELLTQGLSTDEVLDYFVEVYGESILAVPKKEGFALSAWVMPFLGVGLGMAIASWLSWRWARQRREVSARIPAPGQPDLTAYREQVERDLERQR